jgi:hypothetical protein
MENAGGSAAAASLREGMLNGVVLNARIVGDVETIVETVKQLWIPGMKLVVTIYCPTPDEQAAVYVKIHELCRN